MQPASPGPQVNAHNETAAKENVPEQKMEKQLMVDKQVSHLSTWSEQSVAFLLPGSVHVNIWEHQDRLHIYTLKKIIGHDRTSYWNDPPQN